MLFLTPDCRPGVQAGEGEEVADVQGPGLPGAAARGADAGARDLHRAHHHHAQGLQVAQALTLVHGYMDTWMHSCMDT